MYFAIVWFMADPTEKRLNPPLLKLHHISKIRGNHVVLRKLDLELFRGDSFLVTGSNGAGKTTLIRILAGLSTPSAGEVHRAQDLQTGYLGHSTFIYRELSARQNLVFWARMHKTKAPAAAIDDALEQTGLKHHENQLAGTFSRGMSQKLNFARVLLVRPQILLLDEPFTGIDNASRESLLDGLSEMKKKGTAIVMVSHKPDSECIPGSSILYLRDGQLRRDPPC